ncbi:MAG TPA: MipA/OmpV family protein [Bryobacteraceae bacterium]|nr:MipA/OmpV family protein [Bryobacteraceae bacterium]
MKRMAAGLPSAVVGSIRVGPLVLALVMWTMVPATGSAQTPSPLQEWQYPGGISLYSLFMPEIPKWRTTLGLAEVVQPRYAGSHAYRLQSGPVIDVRYFDVAFASVGEGLGVNFLHGKHYRVGMALGYDLGRGLTNYYERPRGFGDIPPAPVVKLFGSYVISKGLPLILRADVRQFVGGADGAIGDLEVFMPLPGSSANLIMLAGPSITFADRLYQSKEFGISAAQSAASGFPQFNAYGSANAVGMGFSATWIFREHWLVNTEAAVDRLLGSGAVSPVTTSKLQETVAVSFSYRWESASK